MEQTAIFFPSPPLLLTWLEVKYKVTAKFPESSSAISELSKDIAFPAQSLDKHLLFMTLLLYSVSHDASVVHQQN